MACTEIIYSDFKPGGMQPFEQFGRFILLEHIAFSDFQHDMKMVRGQGVPEPVHILFKTVAVQMFRRDVNAKFGTDGHHLL